MVTLQGYQHGVMQVFISEYVDSFSNRFNFLYFFLPFYDEKMYLVWSESVVKSHYVKHHAKNDAGEEVYF